jgi:3D (Asp-Asp-Asp) domain-containing protein
MKFSFCGSGTVTGALVAGSFLLFVPASIAKPLQHPSSSEGQKKLELQKQIFPGRESSIEKKQEPVPLAGSETPTVNTEEIKKASEVGKPKDTLQLASGTETEPSRTESAPVTFSATAYSLYGRTASGTHVRKGVIAADRRVLPIGTRVKIESGNYTGEYEVCDTGSAVRGKRIDVWVPSTREAMKFGRRNVKLTVLSYPKRPTKVSKTHATAK